MDSSAFCLAMWNPMRARSTSWPAWVKCALSIACRVGQLMGEEWGIRHTWERTSVADMNDMA